MSPESERHHEETLLAQRYTIFLLWNSILFAGFAMLDNSDFILRLTVVSAALIAIPIQVINTERVRQTLSQLSQEEHPKWKKPFAGCYIGFWFSGLFAAIWASALATVLSAC